MKVYISVDMEGITGITSGLQIERSGKEYERARKLMAMETNAAVEGALAAGATEVVVNDSHDDMANILLEELNPAAVLITGHLKRMSMVEGLDETYDAAFFVGYHARAGARGVLSHTYSMNSVVSVEINGGPASEALINAGVAGSLGVPVVLVTGDRTAVEEARKGLGGWVETVVTKEPAGRYAAKCFHPQVVSKMVREAAERALRNLSSARPFVFAEPTTVEIVFRDDSMADRAELMPGVERVSERTCRYIAPDYRTAYRGLRVMVALADACP